MSPLFSHLLIPFLVAMFLAVNMGGSGTAPSFSAAYGANIIRRFSIPGLFGICVFAGALIAGKKVSLTMGRDIINPAQMTIVVTTIVLFSIALSIFFANLLSVPQSTSQASVLALLGAVVFFGDHDFKVFLTEILPVWFILPVISFIIMLLGYRVLMWVHQNWFQGRSININRRVIKILVLVSACYVAFSIGANNVANAAGPIAGMVVNELGIDRNDQTSFMLVVILSTLMIAPCFAIGSSLFGFRLVKETGKGIIQFGYLGAIGISFITASLLLVASLWKGVPASLVQLNTFAIMALSISKRGWKNTLTHSKIHKIWLVWLVAPVFAFGMSYLLLMAAERLGMIG